MDIKMYDLLYSKKEYHWDNEPNRHIVEMLDFLPSSFLKDKIVIDLGCGEGEIVFCSLKRVA